MRIGLIGPAASDDPRFEGAVRFLLDELKADQTIYLGENDAVECLASRWTSKLAGAPHCEDDFLSRAAEEALHGSPESIRALLDSDAVWDRLARLRTLPPPPARAVEMVAERIMLMVHQKSILDEDDIANAALIAYGDGSEPLFKQFGSRYFFTPGPLSDNRIGLLMVEEEDVVIYRQLNLDGAEELNEILVPPGAKLQVST